MKLLVFLAFAGMAVLAMPAGAETQATGDKVQKAPAVCPKNPVPQQPANQLDFAGNSSGLQFDPFAPGGARPAATPESQRVGVDPTTVTLFPTTEASTEPTTTGKTENHAEDQSCP